MVCPAYFLVFLVSSTYAATTYNLPLLQETLEIIGGDIFTSVTNMLNGGDFNEIAEGKGNSLYEPAEDQPNGIDEDDQEESLTKTAIVVPEQENVSEAPKVSEEKKPTDTTNIEASDNATETEDEDQEDDDNTVDDEESNEEDKPDDEKKPEDENAAGLNKLENTEEGEETKPEKEGGENSGNQVGAGENNEEDEENEDDDDEAKILASAVVNIAAQKIKQKLEDLEIMN